MYVYVCTYVCRYGTAQFKLDTCVYQTRMHSIDLSSSSRVNISTQERTRRIIHLLLSLFTNKFSISHHIRASSRV